MNIIRLGRHALSCLLVAFVGIGCDTSRPHLSPSAKSAAASVSASADVAAPTISSDAAPCGNPAPGADQLAQEGYEALSRGDEKAADPLFAKAAEAFRQSGCPPDSSGTLSAFNATLAPDGKQVVVWTISQPGSLLVVDAASGLPKHWLSVPFAVAHA